MLTIEYSREVVHQVSDYSPRGLLRHLAPAKGIRQFTKKGKGKDEYIF